MSSQNSISPRKLRRPKSDNLIRVLSASLGDQNNRTSGKTRETDSFTKKCSSLNASASASMSYDPQDSSTSLCQSPRGYLDIDIIDALLPTEPDDADDDDDGTKHSNRTWNGTRGEPVLHRDSCVSMASIKSDGSDGFILDDRHHDANNSLRGDNASALLAIIASLKVFVAMIFDFILFYLMPPSRNTYSMILEVYDRY